MYSYYGLALGFMWIGVVCDCIRFLPSWASFMLVVFFNGFFYPLPINQYICLCVVDKFKCFNRFQEHYPLPNLS